MDEIKVLEGKVAELERKLDGVIADPRDIADHFHSGFDVSKIRVADLNTVFYKEASLNPASLVDGAGETLQVTGVMGATLGDFVVVSAPYDLQDMMVSAYVQALDTVEIRIQNESGTTINLAEGTWRLLVIKKLV